MKNILYIVSTLSRGGPTNQLYNLVKHLDREQFSPYLISLSPESKDSRWDDFSTLGVQLYCLNLSRIKGLLFAKSKVKALIKIIEPDVIHTQGIRADVIISKLHCAAIRFCTIHNHPQQDYPMTYGNFLGSLMIKSHVKALKHFDVCIGVSKAVERNLNNLASNVKTNYITNGVDTNIFSSVASLRKQKLRDKLFLPKDAVIWIVLGHLSPLKDPEFIISNWQKKFQIDQNNILLFIGSGSLFAECENLTREASNIILQGQVYNVEEFLQASDYFISASKSEGLPMAAIEALACGLPILLSNIEPHEEILTMNENIGNSFKLGSSLSFSNAIDAILEKNKTIVSQAIYGLVSSQLSAEIMSKHYQSLYFYHLQD